MRERVVREYKGQSAIPRKAHLAAEMLRRGGKLAKDKYSLSASPLFTR
jgi:hypothetical protein